VAWIAEQASKHGCALRVGVNCGSIDPEWIEKVRRQRRRGPRHSAAEHCEILDKLGFTNYLVSLKDSDPKKVIDVNRRFHEMRPDVPLHLGVTEAGLPPRASSRPASPSSNWSPAASAIRSASRSRPLRRQGRGDPRRDADPADIEEGRFRSCRISEKRS
jgi:hypothetical protein